MVSNEKRKKKEKRRRKDGRFKIVGYKIPKLFSDREILLSEIALHSHGHQKYTRHKWYGVQHAGLIGTWS